MALVQTNKHGVVTDTKVRNMDAASRMLYALHKSLQEEGYTLVVSNPSVTCYVCVEHSKELPKDADYCYIVSIRSGRKTV